MEDNTKGVEKLSTSRQWLLRFSQACMTMAHAFNLRMLSDMVRGPIVLSSEPVVILGLTYGGKTEETSSVDSTSVVAEAVKTDFLSRIWCTYRTGFPSIGASTLTTDTGWGCTIRSGQMMLSEALLRVCLGREWRLPATEDPEPAVVDILALVHDDPASALSVHNICTAGVPFGVVPGKWLGPWVCCRALGAAAVHPRVSELLTVYPSVYPGGGAPSLDLMKLRAIVGGLVDRSQQPPEGLDQPAAHHSESMDDRDRRISHSFEKLERVTEASVSESASELQMVEFSMSPTAAPELEVAPQEVPALTLQGERVLNPRAGGTPPESLPEQGDEGGTPVCGEVEGRGVEGAAGATPECASGVPRLLECRSEAEPAVGAKDCGGAEEQRLPASSSGRDEDAAGHDGSGVSGRLSKPVLLLVPVTLGVDKLNPVYYPQLMATLTFPQSVGILGGRVSSSLYFVGYQGTNLLYLDPHQPQPAGQGGPNPSTFFRSPLNLMPISAMDPSLAVGFLIKDADDLEDLAARLSQLAQEHSEAPLMTVHTGGEQETSHFYETREAGHKNGNETQGEGQEEEWEML